MTRENKLIEAWCKYRGKCSTEIMQALAFALKWCDEHPNWVSVEDYTIDELPPLMNEKDPYGESVQVLFVVVLDGVQYINKGNFDYDTGVWHSLDMQCSYCKENVTHWMSLQSIENLKKGDKK
jgi:hypothetical protein